MDRILTGLSEPRPAAFVLAGAAGVGKTRLAATAATTAATLGFSVAKVVATRAATPIPFGPFAPFLPPAGQSSPDLLGLLRLAGDAILALAGPAGKLLLTVDDAQFLDEARRPCSTSSSGNRRATSWSRYGRPARHQKR